MKVITEKDAILARNALLKKGNNLGACAIDMLISDHLQEIDTLTVSKLRPMCDAPKDGSVFLSKHDYDEGLEETWLNGEYFDTSQYCGLTAEDFDGWIPKPTYKPELTGEVEQC